MAMKTFGELKPGDVILDPQGLEVEVKTVYDEHTPERMYEIEFEDGTVIEASGNHLWYVEATTDVSTHRQRLKHAKKLLKPATAKWRDGLENIAYLDEPYEVSLQDVLEILDFVSDEMERFQFVLRLLASVGHVVEETRTYQDMSTGDEIPAPMEKLYDGRRVAQQLLSLTGQNHYGRQWPVIRGRVVTTDEIEAFYQDADFPVLKSLG